jgi:predicted PurR-regulated permease PerM
MDRRVFMAILLSVVVVALVYLAFRLFEPFLLSILWAAVLAVVTHEGHAHLARRLGGRSTLAALLMTFLVFVVLVGPFVLLIAVLTDEAVTFLGQGDLETRLAHVMEHPWIARAREWVETHFHADMSGENIVGPLRRAVPVLEGARDAVLFVFDLLWGVVLMLLSLFFFYRDGRAIVAAFRELIPMADSDRDEILSDIQGAINASVRGGLLVALVQGLLGFAILLLLGLSRPALGAAAMALASFVPLFGTTVIWLPISLYLLFLANEPVKGLVLAGYGAIVIGGADNLVRPIFLGRHMEAHPLMLFLGVLGGLALFGFAGIVLGPIVVAFLNVAARLLRRRFAAQ